MTGINDGDGYDGDGMRPFYLGRLSSLLLAWTLVYFAAGHAYSDLDADCDAG